MSYTATPVKSDEKKKENAAKIKAFHAPTLLKMGYSAANFSCKSLFANKVYFFKSELEKDLVIEVTDHDNEALDEKRTLYLFPAMSYTPAELNTRYDGGKYNQTAPDHAKSWGIPFSDGIKIWSTDDNQQEPLPEPEQLFEIPSSISEDEHYSNLTIMDLLAIIQAEPLSNKQYLNEAILKIKKSRK